MVTLSDPPRPKFWSPFPSSLPYLEDSLPVRLIFPHHIYQRQHPQDTSAVPLLGPPLPCPQPVSHIPLVLLLFPPPNSLIDLLVHDGLLTFWLELSLWYTGLWSPP